MYDWHKAEKLRMSSDATLHATEVELPVWLLYPDLGVFCLLTLVPIYTKNIQDMPRSTSAAGTGNGEEPNMYTRKPGITLI